jgi:hypothetical protein
MPGRPSSLLGRFAGEVVGVLVAWDSSVSFNPPDFRCPSFLLQGVKDGADWHWLVVGRVQRHPPAPGRSLEISWVKGHAGNEEVDVLAGKAAEKTAWSPTTFQASDLREV